MQLGKVKVHVQFAINSSAPAMLRDERSEVSIPVAFPICRIGRDPSCELMVVGDTGVSRVHCLIGAEEGYFFVADAGSTNGTFLNGNMLIEKTPIKDGDELQLSALKLRFLYDRDGAAPPDASEAFRAFVDQLHERLQSEPPEKATGYSLPTTEFKIGKGSED
jgi:pSer/pThr/pTyr-binding forkhead associated (FHA) protein